MVGLTNKPVAVIAGAGGTVGASLARALAADGWDVVALTRKPGILPRARWLEVDLLDGEATRRALRSCRDATHLFCAARYNFAEGGREPLEENLAIVRNAVEALDESAPNLRHVHIVQGSKYYGSHVGPFETPAKEDQPRGLVANFYYLQQDYLVEKQHGARWTWSASRPDALIHGTAGVGRNLVAVIAAYALICRELSVPFYFPGGAVAYDALYQCTSIDQLTAAIAWMSEAPNAANQAFNVVNGDYFRWSALWPVFAEHFGLRLGPARRFRLKEAMADKGRLWDAIVARHKLSSPPFAQVANWDYGDYILSREWDVMSDMTKARLRGFHRTVETTAEFLRFFDELRSARAIP
jgi:nucleoside-diphosphate-sugar epimerase